MNRKLMNSKFENVPDDKDTKVTYQKEITIGGYEALYQRWCWDGVCADSVIFANTDVSSLSDDELINIVREFELFEIGSSYTLKRSDSGYTFVNFNFVD